MLATASDRRRNPTRFQGLRGMELAGLEPATSWVRYARALNSGLFRLCRAKRSVLWELRVVTDACGLPAIGLDSGTGAHSPHADGLDRRELKLGRLKGSSQC